MSRGPLPAAHALAVLATLALLWLAAGVGLIGRDGDPDNRLYLAVLAVGLLGAALARGRPAGMARTLAAMALTQAAIGVYAIVAGLGRPHSGPLELLGLTAMFVVAFLFAAALYRRAAPAEFAS